MRAHPMVGDSLLAALFLVIDLVGEAGDGAQAVRPDVVLMDVRMPVPDGVEAGGPTRA